MNQGEEKRGVCLQQREYRVGDIVHFEDAKLGREEAQRLGELGFTVYLTHFVHGACDLWVYDYLPPATRDAEGFYIEDEALRMRLLRELRRFPYARTGKTVEACYPILLTEEDRAESQDVLGFARGLWCANQPYYDKNYGYISAEVLLYTSLFAASGQCMQGLASMVTNTLLPERCGREWVRLSLCMETSVGMPMLSLTRGSSGKRRQGTC